MITFLKILKIKAFYGYHSYKKNDFHISDGALSMHSKRYKTVEKIELASTLTDLSFDGQVNTQPTTTSLPTPVHFIRLSFVLFFKPVPPLIKFIFPSSKPNANIRFFFLNLESQFCFYHNFSTEVGEFIFRIHNSNLNC